MTDDFSQLETGASCYVLNSATSIYSYKGSVRSTYLQVGGKWFLTSQTSYNTIPTSSVCISYSDITSINSNAVFHPIYLMIAFELALCVWFLCWWLFRRMFKWRVN